MKVYDRLDRQYQMFSDEYKEAAIRVLDSAWYIHGHELEAFEIKFAQFIGVKHCIGVNSGLDALSLSIRALGIGEGDEVLVPGNTYVASVIGITENRATPIFIEPDDYHNIDADLIEQAVTDRTKAIMVVHLYGQAANMRKIKAVADKYDLKIIEDCAQSHGACFEGKMTGSWGAVGCFSFYPTKILGGFGDGGAITTDDDYLAEKLRMMRNYGSKRKYYNEINGVNSRLDEMQAALLDVKMKHLPLLIEQRQSYAKKYLSGIINKKIVLPKTRVGADHLYYLFVIMCKDRDGLQEYLSDRDIKTLIHYPIPPHLQECYSNCGYHEGDFPITEYNAKHVLSLPFFNGMTDEEIQYVIDAVNAY